jgi:hypothetical protein
MLGKIFITRTGYDPKLGKHVKDPYLDGEPTLGACRPDIRKQVSIGDHIFVISGKIPRVNQYVMGGFEVARKISALDAYREFPEQRLRLRPDGQVTGNVVVDERGEKHPLDQHKSATFHKRHPNYIVGRNPIVLSTDEEVARGRADTVDALQEILKKSGSSPYQIVGHYGTRINETQVFELRAWLQSLKAG